MIQPLLSRSTCEIYLSRLYGLLNEEGKGWLRSQLSVPIDNVLIARQSLKPHGTAAVQLLRADTDLRTEPKFVTVGEAGARIDVNRRRVYLLEEALRCSVASPLRSCPSDVSRRFRYVPPLRRSPRRSGLIGCNRGILSSNPLRWRGVGLDISPAYCSQPPKFNPFGGEFFAH